MLFQELPKQQQLIEEFRNKRKSLAEQEPNPFESAIKGKYLTTRDEPPNDSALKEQLSTMLTTKNADMHATKGNTSYDPFGNRRKTRTETMQLKNNAEHQIK